MADIIKLLPDHVANQIAAGEVIQRPASVVKELLENAIDAGSTEVKLVIREGGKTFIQVIDNGKGMSNTDARLCWERHATSKISQAEDIFQVKTMGFRGEALASIASIAQVEMKTKRAEDALGTWIMIEASEVKKQEPVAFENGTSITVKNLFYNIPARRNFLKSNPVETRHIIDEFIRVALPNPQISFTLHNNDEEVYRLPAGALEKRIENLFNYKPDTQLLGFSEETTIARISGFAGKPEFAKKTRGEQFFFVNKRFIKDGYLNHAVMNSYENIISKEQFPFYVVNIEIDPAHIDINVHPTKTEIKFEDERSLYQLLRAILKKAIGEHYHVPTFEPASDDTFLNLPNNRQQLFGDETTIGSERTAPTRHHESFQKPVSRGDWQELFSVLSKKETVGDIRHFQTMPSETEQTSLIDATETSRSIIQIHSSVIISQVKTGMLVIDQEAAHERILFEKYLYALQQHPVASQQKLFPKSITLNTQDEQLLKDILPEVRLLGFDINELGKNTFVINGLPAEMHHYNEQELVEDMLENYKKQQPGIGNKQEKIARTLAKRAAIKAGTRLNQEEMTLMIDELFACSTPHLSPDGKPCLVKLSLEEVLGLIR